MKSFFLTYVRANSKYKRKITIRALALLVFFIFASFLTFFLPTTALYKSAVRALWYGGYRTAGYYLNRDDANLAVVIGNYYFGGGTYDLRRAEASYCRAFAIDPKVHLAHYQLARIYFVEGDLARATEYINDELVVDPYNLRPYYVRGLIEDAQGNLPAAEADFARFVAWAPGEWGGYNDLAYVEAREGKYAKSEATVRTAQRRVPDAVANPWLWNSLGLAQLNQLRYADAMVSFQKALTLAKALTEAQWRRAYSGNDPVSDANSIESFQQAIQQNLTTAKTGVTI